MIQNWKKGKKGLESFTAFRTRFLVAFRIAGTLLFLYEGLEKTSKSIPL